MKIVFFRFFMAYIGGLEKVWIERMNYLASAGFDIYFITVFQGQHPMSYVLSSKVKHIDMGIRSHAKYKEPFYKRPFLDYKYNKLIQDKFQYLIADINPDIITAVVAKDNKFIFDIKTEARIIMESHQAKAFTHSIQNEKNIIFSIYRKWKEKKAFKIIEKKCDAIVTLTNGDAKDWNTDCVVTIPNVVDTHKQVYSPLKNKVALFAGRFSYEKGLETMLEIWKLVVAKRNDWILRLVGEGGQKEELVRQSKILGIEKNVIFVETAKDMLEEYSNASLFLLCSRHEGLPMVLIEAISFGLPCISFDCPHGPTDIIDNGQNGIIIKDRNVEEFANAVLKLIEDEELRQSMGKAAIEKSKMYLPEIIMPKWIELYNKLKKNFQ